MNIQEILQIMSDNAKPDENGDICNAGHIMHNIQFDGAPISVVKDHILASILRHPDRFTLAPSKESIRIKELEAALLKLINIAEECDSWESFPLNEAYDCFKVTPTEVAK
tara:strand:- start:154 stop:483 length:330 start_codon:yes stop_codon:yes gene_type:complete